MSKYQCVYLFVFMKDGERGWTREKKNVVQKVQHFFGENGKTSAAWPK